MRFSTLQQEFVIGTEFTVKAMEMTTSPSVELRSKADQETGENDQEGDDGQAAPLPSRCVASNVRSTRSAGAGEPSKQRHDQRTDNKPQDISHEERDGPLPPTAFF
jgi:hypothetical protein